MKRTFALVALLAALGVLFKLAWKTPLATPIVPTYATPAAAAVDPAAVLLSRYTAPADRNLVERTLERYRQTAVAVEKSDGLRGLALLEALDIEAVYLFERRPDDFRRLREALTDSSAAEILLHWREYFGLKRTDDADRGRLIAEIARLSPAQRKVGGRHPAALPLLLTEPRGVTEMIERWSGDPKDLNDLLVLLDFISLEKGPADLRATLRAIEERGTLALDAFRAMGPDGFALVCLYGPVLDALEGALPTDQALILLRVNADDVDELLRTHRPETVAGYIRHVSAAGLVEAVGNSGHGLRLLVEHGGAGEQALRQSGGDAADVAYDDFADPTLRNQAVAALAAHGPMALAVLEKYAADPDFREILRTHGPAVVPPIASTDAAPESLRVLRDKSNRSFKEELALAVLSLSNESGQATIRAIKDDGLERVASLNDTGVEFYQFLPLYDLCHLGNVVRQGYAPTTGELTWALIDACFVTADVLSLAAVQPEGAAASEIARAEVKAAARASAVVIGREGAEIGAEAAAKSAARAAGDSAATRAARWWVVRSAGGPFKVLRRTPEALPRLTLAQISDSARPLAARAGLRLSTWTPVRLLKDGREFVLRIPPERGLKYLGAQAASAGVGVVGFRKMEEHLASRRPASQAG
jgi:hypothetical protein